MRTSAIGAVGIMFALGCPRGVGAQQPSPRLPPLPAGHDTNTAIKDTSEARAAVRAVVTRQMLFKAQRDRYTRSLTDLRFTPIRGIQVTVPEADSMGFSVVAAFPRQNAECAMYYGRAIPPRSYATAVGVIVCTSLPAGRDPPSDRN